MLGSFLADAFAGDGWQVVRAGRRSVEGDGYREVEVELTISVSGSSSVAGGELAHRNPRTHARTSHAPAFR